MTMTTAWARDTGGEEDKDRARAARAARTVAVSRPDEARKQER
ncbi:hypothetical protein [Streptomyces axinellae]